MHGPPQICINYVQEHVWNRATTTHFQTATTSTWGLKWDVTNNNFEESYSEQKRQIQHDLEYCQKHFHYSKFDPRRNGISRSLLLVPKVSFKCVIYDLISFTPTWLCKTSTWTYDDLDRNLTQETVQTNKNFFFLKKKKKQKMGGKEKTQQTKARIMKFASGPRSVLLKCNSWFI